MVLLSFVNLGVLSGFKSDDHQGHEGARKTQYSTVTKYRPLGGTVAPAAARFRFSRLRLTSSACNVPFPTNINVPTISRPMRCKKPLPRPSYRSSCPTLAHSDFDIDPT